MDKRVVFAVAGSGKTQLIISGLTEQSRALIITYTEKNTANLKSRVLQKFGYIPTGIRIYTYYKFLYSFCFKPILGHRIKSKGITWDNKPPKFAKQTSIKYFMDKSYRLYGNRISKLLMAEGAVPELISRIEKYFDHVYIDEVQDFAGNDFNLLSELANAEVHQLLVGDFFQHTFDTSRDGNVNVKLHDDYAKYQEKLQKSGFTVDVEHLSHSYRCSPQVCEFVTEQIGIELGSHRGDETLVYYVECKKQAKQLYENSSTVKLFYQASNRYPGFTENWGATKGEDCYEDVCIVLNPNTLKYFLDNDLSNLKAQTKNKLYVACTRAKGNLYFVSETLYKSYKN
jgi:DNA helicase-2/ATP-dependent DNA helicase PcrA